MPFNPSDPPPDPRKWKPNAELCRLAMSRCEWINCDEINSIQPTDEWLRAVVISSYYQGLADGVKHMAKKMRNK